MSFSRESFIKEAISSKRSEGFIKATLAYADSLVAKNLPVIFSRSHLSLLLNIPKNELNHIMEDRSAFYAYYPIKKKSGGVRQISSPYSNLKEIQRWIYKRILINIPVSDCAMGFVKGRSIINNSNPHVSRKYVLKIDLLKFFDSITEYRVSKIFEDIGYARNVAIDLARLTTVPLHEDYYDTFAPKDQKVFKKYFEKEIGVLPQGAPTSPVLSNLILSSLDHQLLEYAKKKDCSYTRYADDLTFSTDKAGSIPKKSELIDIIKSERLYVNFHKIHLYPQGKQRTVTGLTITNGLHVPKAYRKDIDRHLFFCIKYGPLVHIRKIGMQDKKFFKEWLLGRIHFVSSVDKLAAERMYSKFTQINWPV